MHLKIFGFLLAIIMLPLTSHASLMFEWEWTNTSPQNTGDVIKGTISGLTEGNNSGTGVSINILDTPTGLFEGVTDWVLVNATNACGFGVAFVVTGGAVTCGDARYSSAAASTDRLFFGGSGGYVPELSPIDSSLWFDNDDPEITYSAVAVPAPVTLSLIGLGLAGIGYRRRKQIKAA